MRSAKAIGVVSAAFLLAGSFAAHADERKFTYSYEAKTLPEKTWEFEQWATVQAGKNGGDWTTLLLREEIEYGITDRLTTAIYLNLEYQANRNVPGFADDSVFGFSSMSSEWKYKLTDPSTDPVGVLLYGELAFSPESYGIELKLVLSKAIGPWTFAYNFVYEFVYNHADDPAQIPQWTWENELMNTVGASYGVTPQFAVGVEAVDIFRLDLFNHTSNHAVFIGPNVHVSGGSWWATLTVLKQIGQEYTDGDNTGYAVRLIFGINF